MATKPVVFSASPVMVELLGKKSWGRGDRGSLGPKHH